MFVIIRTMTVSEGNADKVVERFSKPGSLVEQQPGFINIEVMVKQTRRGEEEVVILFRWESEEAWKNWEKSDAHIQGHRQNAGQPKPEYVLNATHARYDVKAVKGAAEPTS
ncbi:antibiotic biosynthesis monooxygenase family protein [Paenibacillus wulumuqiensis]|uniref:antibiotic biosynthesis monooxygenase family protein n=1 Tax=Paenibacillus wulumuqiensis TaxID=1567107 RepID=UPI0006191165|nr:antibiotic biosynthesis monooxygenase [Paenibacillus wulumuqiensis]